MLTALLVVFVVVLILLVVVAGLAKGGVLDARAAGIAYAFVAVIALVALVLVVLGRITIAG